MFVCTGYGGDVAEDEMRKGEPKVNTARRRIHTNTRTETYFFLLCRYHQLVITTAASEENTDGAVIVWPLIRGVGAVVAKRVGNKCRTALKLCTLDS